MGRTVRESFGGFLMKLVMVDLDGTLFDTCEVNFLSYADAMRQFNYKLDYNYYKEYCNGKHYLEFLPQITTHDKKILEQIHEFKKQAYKKYVNKAIMNELLIDLLRKLKVSAKIALVTTASKANVNEILEVFGVTDIFDLILTREDVKHEKPNPEGFLTAMKYFNVSPKQSIIFEDSEVGIMAAEKTGALCLVVKGYNG